MGAKLKDIASALNVSISTVSYALNGGPRPVPEEVRKRVLDTAREMGYRPNRTARSLAAGRTMTIGVVSFILNQNVFGSPYFQGCFGGIIQEAKRLDYDILLYTHDADAPDRLANLLLNGRVDGLIFIAPYRNSNLLMRIAEERVPFVGISASFSEEAPAFTCDNRAGIFSAVEHLYDLGHRQFAHFAGDPKMSDAVERLAAFREAMDINGLDCREDWIQCNAFLTDTAYRNALSLLRREDRPTAIVCASDEIAAGIYRAAWELGLSIPDDLSVTGFDDTQAAAILFPGLTTIRQPLNQMGAGATRALVDLLHTKATVFEQERTAHRFDTEIVIRQSTARPTKVLV